jgi:serine/threonine protein kinase
VSLVLGRYQLLKEIAIGGMAEIHVAKQTGVEGFEKLVVIKKILPQFARDPHFVKMFLNEARLAARLSHPNVVHIYDLGYANGVYYIAMEYIHGENLSGVTFACRKQKRTIPLEHALKMVSQICEGLHYAHTKTDVRGKSLGIVHRDVSPQNILISYEGVVKLVDFGVAKAATRYDEDTRAGLIKGKLAYMSPEQALGRPVDHRSDIFSTGILLFELLSGINPFRGDNDLATLEKVRMAEVPLPRSTLQDDAIELFDIAVRALERRPKDRYQSAGEMHEALEAYSRKHGFGSRQLARWMSQTYPGEEKRQQEILRRARQRVEEEQQRRQQRREQRKRQQEQQQRKRQQEQQQRKRQQEQQQQQQQQRKRQQQQQQQARTRDYRGRPEVYIEPVEAAEVEQEPIPLTKPHSPPMLVVPPRLDMTPRPGSNVGKVAIPTDRVVRSPTGKRSADSHQAGLHPLVHVGLVAAMAGALFVILYLVVWRPPERPVGTPPVGSVRITIKPPFAATVFVDDQLHGAMNAGDVYRVERLLEGKHRLQLRGSQFQTVETAVEVVAGKTTPVDISVQPR